MLLWRAMCACVAEPFEQSYEVKKAWSAAEVVKTHKSEIL